MNCRSSRFNPALILGALVLVMILLGGCVAGTSPLPTSVPIATWVAQGIPSDTFISYDWESVSSGEVSDEITITADGTVTSESWAGSRQKVEQRKGQISPNDLKQILITLDEINFFALASDGMCIYYRTHPPIPSEVRGGTGYMDYIRRQVSVTVHGVSGSLSTLLRGGAPQKCLDDKVASDAYYRLIGMILEVGRQVPLLTSTPGR